MNFDKKMPKSLNSFLNFFLADFKVNLSENLWFMSTLFASRVEISINLQRFGVKIKLKRNSNQKYSAQIVSAQPAATIVFKSYHVACTVVVSAAVSAVLSAVVSAVVSSVVSAVGDAFAVVLVQHSRVIRMDVSVFHAGSW